VGLVKRTRDEEAEKEGGKRKEGRDKDEEYQKRVQSELERVENVRCEIDHIKREEERIYGA